MEEIRQAASAYYSNLSNRQKKAVRDFFEDMDADGDGSISIGEYQEYLNRKGFKLISDPRVFKEFDKDGNGTLDFEEVITLFYIYVTKRMLFCDGCGDFLKGIYFTCIKCFQTPSSYDLCCNCYGNGNFTHHEDAIFYDSYALLHSKGISFSMDKAKKDLGEHGERVQSFLNAAAEITNLCINCSNM